MYSILGSVCMVYWVGTHGILGNILLPHTGTSHPLHNLPTAHLPPTSTNTVKCNSNNHIIQLCSE